MSPKKFNKSVKILVGFKFTNKSQTQDFSIPIDR